MGEGVGVSHTASVEADVASSPEMESHSIDNEYIEDSANRTAEENMQNAQKPETQNTNPEIENTKQQLIEHYGDQQFDYFGRKGTISQIVHVCPPVMDMLAIGFDAIVTWIDEYKVEAVPVEEESSKKDDEPVVENAADSNDSTPPVSEISKPETAKPVVEKESKGIDGGDVATEKPVTQTVEAQNSTEQASPKPTAESTTSNGSVSAQAIPSESAGATPVKVAAPQLSAAQPIVETAAVALPIPTENRPAILSPESTTESLSVPVALVEESAPLVQELEQDTAELYIEAVQSVVEDEATQALDVPAEIEIEETSRTTELTDFIEIEQSQEVEQTLEYERIDEANEPIVSAVQAELNVEEIKPSDYIDTLETLAEKEAPLEELLVTIVEQVVVHEKSNENETIDLPNEINIDDETIAAAPAELQILYLRMSEIQQKMELVYSSKSKEACDEHVAELIKSLTELLRGFGYDNPELLIQNFLHTHQLSSLRELVELLQQSLRRVVYIEAAKKIQQKHQTQHRRHLSFGKFVLSIIDTLSRRNVLADFSI